jgi:hypothetical protein
LSNRYNYDALIGLHSVASLIAATAALHSKGRASTSSTRANVVDLAYDAPVHSPTVDANQPSTVPPSLAFDLSVPKRPMVSPPIVSESSLKPKRKADLPSIRPAKKGFHGVDGVRKAHHKWRVGINPTIFGVKQSRLTVPFDYLTEDVATQVHYFLCSSMSGTKVDPKICDLDRTIIDQLQDFLRELHSGTIDAYLNKVKANARSVKQPSAIPKSNLRGVLYNDGVWVVRAKLLDVSGKEKSTKLPFTYLLEKDAGLAYDFAIVHFCFVINQKMNHKLNFPTETIPIERQAELKCYVEEVLANSYSFQVGKILPAVPILRGVDRGLGAFWTIRLGVFASTDEFFVFLGIVSKHFYDRALNSGQKTDHREGGWPPHQL